MCFPGDSLGVLADRWGLMEYAAKLLNERRWPVADVEHEPAATLGAFDVNSCALP